MVTEALRIRQAGYFRGKNDRSRDRTTTDGALGVFHGFGLIFIHTCKDTHQIVRDFRAHLRNELDSYSGDAHHDFTAIFCGVNPLNIGQFFQPID